MNRFIASVCKAVFIVSFMTATAQAASGDLAQQVLTEMNLARTQPQRYADHLRQFRRQFEGKGYWVPGSAALVITQEGVAAVDEAIEFLSGQRPVPPLTWSKGLGQAAEDLVGDEGETGEVGHKGRHSGSMRERIEKHGTWSHTIAENIGYGPATARLMVTELIVDDGVRGRGHRKNIFSPAFTTAGVACGPHPQYRNMCVIDFAGGYRSKK